MARRIRSVSPSSEVMITPASGTNCASISVTWMPSIPGRLASTTATSGRRCSASWIACSPSPAVPHTTSSLTPASERLRLATICSLPSASSTRIMWAANSRLPSSEAETPPARGHASAVVSMCAVRLGRVGCEVVDQRPKLFAHLGSGFAHHERLPVVDGLVDARVERELHKRPEAQELLDVAARERHLLPRLVEHDRYAIHLDTERLEELECASRALHSGDVECGHHQDLVCLLDDLERAFLQMRRCVDHDVIVRLAQLAEDGTQIGGRHQVGELRAGGGKEHANAGGSGGEHLLENFGVDDLAVLRKILDGGEVLVDLHHHAGIAVLQVEVDQCDARTRVDRESDGEVRGDHRFADAALARVHEEDLAARATRPTRTSRDDLLHGLLRLGRDGGLLCIDAVSPAYGGDELRAGGGRRDGLADLGRRHAVLDARWSDEQD